MRVDVSGFLLGMLFLLLNTSRITVRSAIPIDPFYGISPQDDNYYRVSSDFIRCKDGSKNFSKAQLNDDFCDCPDDASDEPGTSACPGGKFYCRNAAHTPIFIFSSRVNDGVCDCCDGSDEYDGQVNCQNTCWEAGKAARDKLKKKIATYKDGVALRRREIELAKLGIAKDEAELAKLRDEEKILKGLVQQLKEHKEQIEKAEEKECLEKEKKRKEAEEKVNDQDKQIERESKQETAESINDDKVGNSGDSSADEDPAVQHVDYVADEAHDALKSEGSTVSGVEQHVADEKKDSVSQQSKDGSLSISETGHDAGSEVSHDQAKKDIEISETTEGLSKEELGRLVASRWTGTAEKKNEEVNSVESDYTKDHEEHEDMPQEKLDDDGYTSETDDDTGKYDDIDAEDDAHEPYVEEIHDDTSSSYNHDSYDDSDAEDDTHEAYEEEIHDDTSSSYSHDSYDDSDFSDNPSWLEKIQQTVRNILQAVNLFQTPVSLSDAARVRKEYEKSSTKLSKLQSKISSLTRKLKHDFGREKEFYSFYDRCFESKENQYVYKICPFKQASQVEGYSTTSLGQWDKFEDSYRAMVFSNGDKCWNGPDRSLKVKLRCGSTNEVTEVDEPSRCEYVGLLYAPALCVEERLKELEGKLERMNKEQADVGHDEL
ncbi:hypothetical protein K2173_014513 [Erythroxylum novogranatense]|uniref:Glucosidase 2 subunit beta n=1 Tax=Erythroxylum novogranatense TaxID=1862640 RepID=A0AAV8S6P5_9ROSI|nr:hypothetical protein K2173_014513 [Erythroxylum novogranatense]